MTGNWHELKRRKVKKKIWYFWYSRHYICSTLRIHWHKYHHWNRPVPNIAQKYNKSLRLEKCQNSRDKDHWKTWKITYISQTPNISNKIDLPHNVKKGNWKTRKKSCNFTKKKYSKLFYGVFHIAKLFYHFFTLKQNVLSQCWKIAYWYKKFKMSVEIFQHCGFLQSLAIRVVLPWVKVMNAKRRA